MNFFRKFHATILSVALIGTSTVFQSCESDDDGKVDFESGVLVVNEGKFQAGTGTVNYYNPANGESVENIFRNSEGFAGDVLQSITIHNDRAYLVLNGDNKIEIANGEDFTSQATYSAPILDKPRYVQIVGDKAFISVWGPYEGWDLVNSCVLVVNATTMAPLDTIYTDEGTENLIYNGQYIFASNFNYGSSNTVSIIDPSDNSLVDEIELSAGPAGSVIDKNNKLWVITTGSGETMGKLFRINPTTFAVEDDIDLGGKPGGDLALTPSKDELVYNIGKKIYKISIAATEAPEAALIDATGVVAPYALGVDPTTGEIYFGDAKDYASPGQVNIYKTDGTFKTSITSGICPGQFIFR